MKRLLPIVLSILVSPAIPAQDVDLKPISVSFAHLPEDPLPPELKTYFVQITASNETMAALRTNHGAVQHAVQKLNRYKFGPKADADFTVEVFVEEMKILSETTEGFVSFEKDKAGNTITKNSYRKQCTYKLPMGYRLLDRQGVVIRNVVVSKSIEKYEGKDVENQAWLEQDWKTNRQAYISTHANGVLKRNQDNILSSLQATIDVYPVFNQRDEFEVIGGKSEEAAGYQDAYNTVKTTFALIQPYEPLYSVKLAVQPVVEFYQAESAKFSPTDKKQYKWLHVCLYNLALIHYWLDEPVQAKQYAEACMKIDWMRPRTLELLKKINELNRLFEFSGFPDRHPMMIM